MMKSPALADIQAAELRLVAAKQRTAEGKRRAWHALQSALARPSSLAVVAAAGFCGGWLVSRPRAAPAKKPGGKESFAGLLLAVAVRYAVRNLPTVISRMAAENRRGDTCAAVETP